MSSPLLTASLSQEALDRERFAGSAAQDLLPDLNLNALEQQFFVEWEVPQPDGRDDGAVPLR